VSRGVGGEEDRSERSQSGWNSRAGGPAILKTPVPHAAKGSAFSILTLSVALAHILERMLVGLGGACW
jgi:hypothetical protein